MGINKNKLGAGLRPFSLNIIMVILFIFFILGFSLTFINNQNPNSEILSSKYGLNSSMNKMETSLNEFKNLSSSLYSDEQYLGAAQPSAVDYVFLIFKGAFYIPIAFAGLVFNGLTTITAVTFPALAGTGLGNIVSIVIGIIFASLLVTIILLIVSAIRSGSSER